MSNNLEDTRPKPSRAPYRASEVPAPPRFLLWAVIGLFILGILGAIGGVVVFRSLEPAYQQRIIGVLPFMNEFLPPRPAAGDTLPTPESATGEDVSPDDLLSGLFDEDTTTDDNGNDPVNNATEGPAGESPVGAPLGEATNMPTEAPTQIPTVVTEVPTLTPTYTPTVSPTLEPTASTQNTAPDEQSVSIDSDSPSLISAARLTGFRHEQQTWNNCGPTNITMALSYYGWTRDQTYAAQFLKPGGREDKNVNPSEMAQFVNENSDLRALTRMGGTVALLKTFISNDIPVIIETGYMPEGYDWIGHYQTIVGYDDNSGVFWLYDSFLGSGENGEGISVSYNYLDQYWEHFNHQFIIIYEPQREATVRTLLGEYADPNNAAEIALKNATERATADPTNGFAWFNMGSALVALGEYDRAATAYDRAIREGLPWRMLWYQFGPYEAYLNAGRYNDVLSLTDANLSNGGEYVEETYYWQGKALAESGDLTNAGVAFRNAIRRNPDFIQAQEALSEYGL